MDAAVGAEEIAFLFCHIRACVKTKAVLVLFGDLAYGLHKLGMRDGCLCECIH